MLLGNPNAGMFGGSASGVPWDISTAVYAGKEFDPWWLGSLSPMTMKGDGSCYIIMYATETYRATMSTPCDITTSTYGGNFNASPPVTSGDTWLKCNPDGTRMFVAYGGTSPKIAQFNLSTPWNNTTASYSGKQLDLSSAVLSVYALAFSTDGTKLYFKATEQGTYANYIWQYTLSTAWDISTASASVKKFRLDYNIGSNVRGLVFKTDGSSMYISNISTDTIWQFDLTTAWDVSTAQDSGKHLSVGDVVNAPYDLAITDDGTMMVVLDAGYDNLYQYSMGG